MGKIVHYSEAYRHIFILHKNNERQDIELGGEEP
jgi:hypothetical protein